MILGDREALITRLRDKILSAMYRCTCSGGCSICEYTREVSGWDLVNERGYSFERLIGMHPASHGYSRMWADLCEEHYGIEPTELVDAEVPVRQ
jgi:hypothetical protein